MADTKISALTASTTPLAGTEVLPIVQSGVTKQVSVANLTAGRDITTGAITSTISSSGAYNSSQVNNTNAGGYARTLYSIGAAGANGVASIKYAPGIFFAIGPESDDTTTPLLLKTNNGTTQITVGTDSNVTLAAGNLVIGTSGKGIDFSATAGTGTSELLADYEEGTWTGTLRGSSAAPTTPVTATFLYTKIGRQVYVNFFFDTVNLTGASGNLQITGLPYTSASSQFSGNTTLKGLGSAVANSYLSASTTIAFVDALTDNFITVVAAASKTVRGTLTYTV
jgi:hypothetical protein